MNHRSAWLWLCAVLLYCTAVLLLYCSTGVLYCTVLYCNCTVLYCTVLYCTVLYCTALHCTALHCTVLGRRNGTISAALQTFPSNLCDRHEPPFCLGVTLYCTKYCTTAVLLYWPVLCCTVQFTMLYDTIVLLHCTYCTALHCILYSVSKSWLVLVADKVVDRGEQQQSANQKKGNFVIIARLCIPESVPWDHANAQRANAYHKGRNFDCSWKDGGRHSGPCLGRGAQRDSAGGMGPCPSRTAAGDTNTDSKLQQHPFPLENKVPPHNFSTLL